MEDETKCATGSPVPRRSGIQRASKPPTPLPPSRSQSSRGGIHSLLTDVVMPGMNGRELAQRSAESSGNQGALHVGLHRKRHRPQRHARRQRGSCCKNHSLCARSKKCVKPGYSIRRCHVCCVRVAAARRQHEEMTHTRAPRFNLHLPLKYRRWKRKNGRTATTKYQPFRDAVPSGGIDLAQCAGGDQPGAASRDCRTFP